MPEQKNLITALLKAKNDGNGRVSYKFADGTTQAQPINPAFFYDEKKKALDLSKVVQNFNDIAHDKGAVSYDIE